MPRLTERQKTDIYASAVNIPQGFIKQGAYQKRNSLYIIIGLWYTFFYGKVSCGHVKRWQIEGI